MQNSDRVWDYVDAKKERFEALADRVWGMPELCYLEHRSAAEHAAELAAQGFRTETGIAGIPTAMMGEAGEGGPVIAILGEYDALPGLSQEAGIAERREVEAGGNGHACGHNLLGSAALLAATAVKDWLAANNLPGRVRYYGCPAEEGGAAKSFMARAGAFDDVDVAITWHPAAFTAVMKASSLANTRIDFSFVGRAAHASGSPHLGRSALDAVELMNVGVNYMREHMPSEARIHYALLDAGGGRAQRGAGARHRALPDPRARTGRTPPPDRARPQDRRGRRADDRDHGRLGGGQRGVEPAAQRRAGAHPCRPTSTASARRPSTPPTAPSRPRSRRR